MTICLTVLGLIAYFLTGFLCCLIHDRRMHGVSGYYRSLDAPFLLLLWPILGPGVLLKSIAQLLTQKIEEIFDHNCKAPNLLERKPQTLEQEYFRR